MSCLMGPAEISTLGQGANRGIPVSAHAASSRQISFHPARRACFGSACVWGILLLGIVSDAQPYTLRELDEGLRSAGLSLAIFEKHLCLWSFEAGLYKPDPHVFRTLVFRLARRGIRPDETLVVGDRIDNDIEPARAQGFQTLVAN